MNWAFTTMASGKFLWAVILFAGVALGILAVKAPAVYRLVTAPFRALWARVKVWKPVAWVLTKISNTLAWKWLESHQYDPPARPLTWYLKAAFVIMVLWGASGYVIFDHLTRAVQVAPSQAHIVQIANGWRNRAMICEANAYTREPAVMVEPLITTVPTLEPTPALKAKDVPGKGAGKGGHKKTFSLLDTKTW